ncbi:MAG TPA: hypothetical protein VLJ15_06945 [Gammaproteobacteria bacterium]|nr:hypothetical protein [Gammaproteobacteria bacterium]
MDRIDDEDYGYHYWHPWLRALCVAALIDIAAETKNACDRTAKFTSAILEAIKSNALPTLFKQYLNHPDVTSDNLYTLAICASNTETLDVLLNCTQELGPDYSKRLFDAVRKHASQDFCDSFLGKARENGIVVESSPGMRPG